MSDDLSAGLLAKIALEKYGFRFTHSLGQNFIFDDQFLEDLINKSEIPHEADVIEIGPGAGVMTRVLAGKVHRLVSIEIDSYLKPVLDYVLNGIDNVEIKYLDFIKLDLGSFLKNKLKSDNFYVVANLPYYITSEAINKLVCSDVIPEKICIMVQKEAADRIMSCPGQKQWCVLSAFVRYYGVPKLICDVPAEFFLPHPHVDSAFITIQKHAFQKIAPADVKLFRKVIVSAFAMRRKTLANNIVNTFNLSKKDAEDVIASAGLDIRIRGEALQLEELCAVSDSLNTLFLSRK